MSGSSKYGRFSKFENAAYDPFAATVDDIAEFYHVQSQSEGGLYLDIIAPATGNFPVSTKNRYFVYFPHAIDQSDLSGTRPITVTDEDTATPLTRVASTVSPGANQYRMAPTDSKRRHVVELHSGQAGHIISFDYYGFASVLDEDEVEIINKVEYDTYTTTANYTITDIDGYRNILCSIQNVGDITITLPTVSDNENRVIKIYKDHNNGKVIVDGKGAEQIQDRTVEYLFSAWDYIVVRSDATQWVIESMYSCINTGWISRSDWTNVHLGTIALDYDSSSGSFIDGEVITGDTSSDSGIIHNSSSITLTLRNIDNNSSVTFINNEIITGTISSATALVNEGSGTAKNLDSNFYHGTGLDFNDFILDGVLSSETSMTGAYKIGTKEMILDGANNPYGIQEIEIDTNNIKMQTATNGFEILQDNGVNLTINNQDWYYKIIWERKK